MSLVGVKSHFLRSSLHSLQQLVAVKLFAVLNQIIAPLMRPNKVETVTAKRSEYFPTHTFTNLKTSLAVSMAESNVRIDLVSVT